MKAAVPTEKAAKMAGISQRTLQRWIRSRKVRAPETTIRNGRAVRLWSANEIELLKQAKEQTYRRGRGRRRKAEV